jgi:uncharacterized membrane protein YbhN (UPF0104 family)
MRTRLRRWLRFLPPVLGVLVLTGILAGLHGALKKISFDDVLAALRATPRGEIYHALALLCLCVCVMMMYDVPGIMFARQRGDCPKLAWWRIGFASACAYALSHVLGAPALSAAAIRLRLYAQWGVPAAGIGRIMTVSGTTFASGSCLLLGAVLLVHPRELPWLGHELSPLGLRATGVVLWALVAGYVALARGKKPISLFGLNIPRPGLAVAAAQVAISFCDIALACGILYTVLPTVAGMTYAHVLAFYLAGFAGGLLSGLPGGVGVFDTLLLLGLAGYMNPADAIGAILLFRVLYYLTPAVLAGAAFVAHEVWVAAAAKRQGSPEKINGSS